MIEPTFGLLSEDRNERKTIIETGFRANTIREITSWVSACPLSEFTSVGLNVKDLDSAHDMLEQLGRAQHCGLLLQDPLKFLQKQSWIDVAFLNSRNGLQYALEEFRLAASAGASMILFTDYQSTGASAILEA